MTDMPKTFRSVGPRNFWLRALGLVVAFYGATIAIALLTGHLPLSH